MSVEVYKTAVKRDNLAHHEIEAEFYEKLHREIFSKYEMKKAKENIRCIVTCLSKRDLSIDVGCGTGFLTGFESPYFRNVVAADLSKQMLKKTRIKFKNSPNLHLLVCDAENLPFRNEVADLVTTASVLHHLPDPLSSISEMKRILRDRGILFITREPNDIRYARFFELLERRLIHTLLQFFTILVRPSIHLVPIRACIGSGRKLDYSKVDIHYPRGFNVDQISDFLLLENLKVVSAYSYHWLFPVTDKTVIKDAVSKLNFIIEKLPFSRRFGRFICIIGKKGRQKSDRCNMHTV